MMAAQAAAMMIFGFLMRLYGKARKLDGRLLDMLDITTGSLNNGFIGLPVATIFFGDVGVMYMLSLIHIFWKVTTSVPYCIIDYRR